MAVGNTLRAVFASQMGVNYNNGCCCGYDSGNSFCNSIFTQYGNTTGKLTCSQKTAMWTSVGNMFLSGVMNMLSCGVNGLFNRGLGAIAKWLG